MRALCSLIMVCAGLAFVIGQESPSPHNANAKKIQESIDRGVKYLIAQQNNDHTWEDGSLAGYRGGCTAFACLALLEAGVKPEDASLKESLNFLRKIRLTKTYCRGLRMAVFAHIVRHYPQSTKPNDKQLLAEDKRKLMLERVRGKGGQLEGWSYPVEDNSANATDLSNTHFAILGLHAAQLAGIDSTQEFWQSVRDMYVRLQKPEGGWCYFKDSKEQRLGMTLAGISGLCVSSQQINDKPRQKEIDRAIQLLSKQIKPVEFFSEPNVVFRYNTLFALDRACNVSKVTVLKNSTGGEYNVFQEMSAGLIKKQSADGSWSNNQIENSSLATSCALIYLSRGSRMSK